MTEIAYNVELKIYTGAVLNSTLENCDVIVLNLVMCTFTVQKLAVVLFILEFDEASHSWEDPDCLRYNCQNKLLTL